MTEHSIETPVGVVKMFDIPMFESWLGTEICSDIGDELSKTVFFFENFFNVLQSENGQSQQAHLEEAYNQIAAQILLIMKTLKMDFYSYEKTEILRYKQHVDGYYFLLKVCKELVMNHHSATENRVLKMRIKEVVRFLRDINENARTNALLPLLSAHNVLLRDKEALSRSMPVEKNPEKLKAFLLLINIYEALLSVIYAHINNCENYVL